ncbi:MAG: type II toxin-antitoxin system RelE/ParE family toxin [Saprospiraceae bacterium]|nr:MAG: type II toxin-antitoxin system RelE/ParE family toxin [Saprospiraceae bacterium]
MVKKVVWRKKALQNFSETYEYLDENFSLQAAENFAKAVDSKIDFS